MTKEIEEKLSEVDCRIGSLEIDDVGMGDRGFVDCRIGSLER